MVNTVGYSWRAARLWALLGRRIMVITSGSDPENRGSNPCAPATSGSNFLNRNIDWQFPQNYLAALWCRGATGLGPLIRIQEVTDLGFNHINEVHIAVGGLLGFSLDDGIDDPQVFCMKGPLFCLR